MWIVVIVHMFQHTATRRWLDVRQSTAAFYRAVSTHSHPKVAAAGRAGTRCTAYVSTHSHPKVAGCDLFDRDQLLLVSTHSHPKVAVPRTTKLMMMDGFQHTATRRWLSASSAMAVKATCFNTQPPEGGWSSRPQPTKSLLPVSTHSHPKVAAVGRIKTGIVVPFQHTATRRWLYPINAEPA